jgi:tRNA 2-thiouridine synthesizing protein A
MADFHLDCKGQRCPKPIIQLSRKMATMQPGQTLRIEADDNAFPADLTAWVAMRGETLSEFVAGEETSIAVLEKR